MVTFLSPCLCYFLEFVSQFYRVLMKPPVSEASLQSHRQVQGQSLCEPQERSR